MFALGIVVLVLLVLVAAAFRWRGANPADSGRAWGEWN